MKIILSAFFILCFYASAEDVTTLSEQIYTNAEVLRAEPDGLVIQTKNPSGVKKIPFHELSSDAQKKYGYDPQNAANYSDKNFAAQTRYIANNQNRIRVTQALEGFRTERDDYTGITYYYDIASTPATVKKKAIYSYVAKGPRNTVLILRAQRIDDMWFFMDCIDMYADGYRHHINLGEVSRDNNSDATWEWCDVIADSLTLDFFQRAVTAKDVKARFIGEKYSNEIQLDKAALSRCLTLYNALAAQ